MRLVVHSALLLNLDHYCKVQLEIPPAPAPAPDRAKKVQGGCPPICPAGNTTFFGRPIKEGVHVTGPVVAVAYPVGVGVPETLRFFPNQTLGEFWIQELGRAWGRALKFPPEPS